jgi:hypothetical protein
MLAARRFIPGTSTTSPARLRWCLQVRSASALEKPQCAVSGASSGRGEGRTIKDAPLARETVEQLDDFARLGQGEARGTSPACKLSSLAESRTVAGCRMGRWPPTWKREIRKLCEVRGRRFRVALLPIEIPRSRTMWDRTMWDDDVPHLLVCVF